MHIALLTACFAQKVRQLRDEEEGLALTEYLLLLGLLVGGIITAVSLFGTSLNTGWMSWGEWMESMVSGAADATASLLSPSGVPTE